MLALWLVVVVIAGIAEITTTGLFMATLSFAALVTAIVSLQVSGFASQLGVFAGVSLLGLILIRPIVIRMLGIRYVTDHGTPLTGNIVAQRGIVSQPVDNHGGQIRIGQAEFWSARSTEPGEVLAVGTPVIVDWVDGLTAMVRRAETPTIYTSDSNPTIEIAGNKGA
jgi:membrane protein implicated in regulation of membrane protease activity